MEERVVDTLFIAGGIVVIILATGLAIRTFMVPNASPPLINRVIFRLTQAIFDAIIRAVRSDERRHQVLSLYAPISLIVVLATIMLLIGFGYTLAFFGVGVKPLIRAFLFSASGLSTLGFESPGNNFWVIILSATEALTMATIVALLIGYLPGIYSSYSKREQAVTSLDQLVGSPPDGVRIVDAYAKSYGLSRFGDLWQSWIDWFNDLASAGSSLSGELYLRSSRWDRSWICAAGAILDAAALVDSSLELSTDPAAERLVSAGSKALREVLETLQLHCPEEPTWPQTSTNISQQEFEEAFAHLAASGLPVKSDRAAAWKAFAQLRVEYECALMTLVRLKKPPRGARWTTDRDEAMHPISLPVTGKRHVGRGLPKDKRPPAA
jgi:hypothetical protein